MFTTEQLPRAFFSARGRGFHASDTSSSLAAGEASVFTVYNPTAAKTAAQKLLVITGLTCSVQTEDSSVRLQRSADVANLEALANILGAGNHCANYMDGAQDSVTKLAQGLLSTYAPAVTNRFHITNLKATENDRFLELEYPLVLPPEQALVVSFHTAVTASRIDKLSVRYFRA